MKCCILLIAIFFLELSPVGSNVLSQDKGIPLILSGKCISVLDDLIVHYENDSLKAYKFFKENYFVIKDSEGYTRCRLSNKKIYKYYSDKRNKETRCVLKKRVARESLLR